MGHLAKMLKTMKPTKRRNIGIGAILLGLFIGLAPIPFLSQVKEGGTSISDMPHMMLRLGQDLATPSFKDVSNLPQKSGTHLLQVSDKKFSIEIDEALPRDEIEATADAAAQHDITRQFASAQRVLFEGWKPSFLPIRIAYRYIFVTAFGMILIGVFTLLRRELHDTQI